MIVDRVTCVPPTIASEAEMYRHGRDVYTEGVGVILRRQLIQGFQKEFLEDPPKIRARRYGRAEPEEVDGVAVFIKDKELRQRGGYTFMTGVITPDGIFPITGRLRTGEPILGREIPASEYLDLAPSAEEAIVRMAEKKRRELKRRIVEANTYTKELAQESTCASTDDLLQQRGLKFGISPEVAEELHAVLVAKKNSQEPNSKEEIPLISELVKDVSRLRATMDLDELLLRVDQLGYEGFRRATTLMIALRK